MLRDLGAVPLALSALDGRPADFDLVRFLAHICRCPAIHASLKAAGVVGALARALRLDPSSSTIIVSALAHLCAGVHDDEADAQAAAVIAAHDVTGKLAKRLDAAKSTGASRSATGATSLSQIAHACASLSRTPANAARLADRRVPAMAAVALGNEHGRAPEACRHLCHMLLWMAEVPDLRPRLHEAGVPAALQVRRRVGGVRALPA
jgi:hypothetical protein